MSLQPTYEFDADKLNVYGQFIKSSIYKRWYWNKERNVVE